MGADVIVDPKGFAGVWVGMGAVIGHADIVPGTVHPPYKSCHENWICQKDRKLKQANLRRVDVDEHGTPILPHAHCVVREDLARRGLACVLRTEN